MSFSSKKKKLWYDESDRVDVLGADCVCVCELHLVQLAEQVWSCAGCRDGTRLESMVGKVL